MSFLQDYITIKGESTAEYSEKHSRFIATCFFCESEQQAGEIIAVQKSKYWDARHNVYAYVLQNGTARFSDDGEPHGTAGMPILEVIKGSGVTNLLIVVTRYFGGILLGTGGLVRAYTQAAQRAVASAEILSYSLCVDLSIEVDYPLYDKLMNICSTRGAKVMDTQYTDKVFVKVRMISGTQTDLVNDIEILTKGRKPDVSEEIYDIF